MVADSLQLPIKAEELRRFLQKYGVVSASLFGSYARGDASPDSDLDLLVTYAPGTNLLKVAALQDELEATAGTQVDLVSAKFMRPQLAARDKPDLIRIM
jgi:predicted nucleotidyltransferase